MQLQIFRDFPWRWGLWWLLLPNLAFIAMWPVGGPSMTASMAMCGLLAVLLSGWGHHLARTAVAVVLFVFNLLTYIAQSFNLNMRTMFESVQFAGELNPVQSPEYVLGGVLLAAAFGMMIFFAPRIPALKTRDHKFLALGLVALLINVDMVATAGTRGSYSLAAPADMPVDSAVLQNDIAPSHVHARNLVVIIVESWGVSSNAFDRAVAAKIWNPARWRARYDVTQGTSRYFGSTTSAELRELCAAWADYENYDFGRSNCLPRTFREAGFQVEAIHSFNGVFFDRAAWYPKIGFAKSSFADDLSRMGAAHCGSVFPGVCDRDVPRLIARKLREEPQKRKFLYWLTVNGHIPVPAGDDLRTDDCMLGTAAWRSEFPMLCRGFELQRQLADSLTAEVMRPDFPDTDILIVGDHMPPYFQRDLRTRFDSAHVPWIMLRSRKPTAAVETPRT